MHGKSPADIPTHGDVDRLLNSNEVRALLGGISESKFRRMCANEEIDVVKQGARVYVRASKLAAYIDSLSAA